MFYHRRNFSLAVLKWTCAVALAATGAFAAPGGGLGNLVVVGDSLSAGYQNDQLIDCTVPPVTVSGLPPGIFECFPKPSGQRFGYANVLATQAGQAAQFNVPAIPPPGYPEIALEDGFAAVVPTPIPVPRENPAQTLDVSVPGYTLAAAVGYVPLCPPNPSAPVTSAPPYPIQVMALEILDYADFGAAFTNPAGCTTAPTELAEGAALAQKYPGTAILWLGANDALFPLLFAGEQPTSPLEFAYLYNIAISTMAQSSKHLVVANIPDVTELPYLTSAAAFAAEIAADAHLPAYEAPAIEAQLGLSKGEMVTPYAFLAVQEMGSSLSQLPSTLNEDGESVPVVITASQVGQIRGAIDLYNAAIELEAVIHHATLVDIHTLVQRIAINGYRVNGETLTTAFGGGLFSYDGVHPTNTGYAIIANQFIDTLNSRLNAGIPEVSVSQVAANDPFFPTTPPAPPLKFKHHVTKGMADGLRALMRHN